MRVDVGGTQLWFDVDGARLVPDGPEMRERPTAPPYWPLLFAFVAPVAR